MKHPAKRALDHAAPKQQRNWDWRAAANFIAGGAGGGLLLCASLVNLEPYAARIAILLGIVLIGCGLTCVWFEIGRPWRAMNVYRHAATSWMTREAFVALALFAAAAWAAFSLEPTFVASAGILGLVFLYIQAQMLAANKGIPAWRHPRCIPLLMASSLTEGAGFVTCLSSPSDFLPAVWVPAGLIALIAARAFLWNRYFGALIAEGAPEGTIKVLSAMEPKFLLYGHVLPTLLVAIAASGMAGRPGLLFAAGIMVVAAGWALKFTLVRRAGFTQGAALQRLPVRGRGAGGAAVKPGWAVVGSAKSG